MEDNGKAKGPASKKGFPELMLVLSTICISPLTLVFLVVDTGFFVVFFWVVPLLLMLAFSTIYLIEIAPRRLRQSVRAGTQGRHGRAHTTYMTVFVVYLAVFVVTMLGPGVVPFILYFGFIPFHASGTLIVTAAADMEQNSQLSRFRLHLAIIQLIFALPWPILLAIATLS